MNSWQALERFFAWLLQTSGQSVVIVAVILLAQFLLRNRLSPSWRYGLWFLLVARLLMPLTPRSVVSVFNLAKWSRTTPIVTEMQTPPLPSSPPAVTLAPDSTSDSLPSLAEPSNQLKALAHSSLPAPNRLFPTTPTTSPARTPFNWAAVATTTWFFGALVFGVRFFWVEFRFRRRLALYLPLEDESIRNLVDYCAHSLRVAGPVEVIETEEVETPAVYGLWRKRLLLPEGLRENLPIESLRHVLLHELAHIKRRDPELNWVLGVIQILHWFNPVLWFAFARMRADREIATDDLALSHTDQDERRGYGETILRVLEGLTQRPALPGLVGIGESKAQIKERIRSIARHGTPRWPWAAGATAVVIAGVTLTNARDESATKGIDLLKLYPTALTVGDAAPGHARPWRFAAEDIFQVSRLTIDISKQLHVEAGVSDLGIGHCSDGAAWAVVIPRDQAKLTSSAADNPETVAHIWLRFHPAQISQIFAPETVSASGQTDLEDRIRHIAEVKLSSSWHAGNRVMLPEPKEMTVDVDTVNGPRRFFVVDTKAGKAEYVAAFAERTVEGSGQPAYELQQDANRASVVSVVPPNGARDIKPDQPLRIRFDRPMNSYNFQLSWLAGGFQLDGSIQLSADRKEFIIPAHLTPGEHKLVLNRDQEREQWIAFGRRPEMKPSDSPRGKGGFVDADGVPANEFRWSFFAKNTSPKPGADKPRVVSVSPPSGATTPVLTPVEIMFDQPMRSSDQTLPYLQQNSISDGPNLIPSFEYDPVGRRFIFPALLRADDDTRLTVKGFYSAEGVVCDPIVIHYQAGTESLDPKYVQRSKAAAKDPKLQNLLASMKRARAQITSGLETVQSMRLSLAKNSFNSIESQTATFKWQGAGQVYADISGPMTMRAFILGSDGQECWLYSENEKGEKRLDQTPAAATQKQILLLDPFSLENQSVDDALAGMDLVYANSSKLEGRLCHRLERWEVNQDHTVWATLTQWWIDEQTFLPVKIVQYFPGGCQIVRFDYAELNQAIPENAFQPPATTNGDAHPLFFQNAPEAGERRFLRICDGSNGRMSGRIGWRGPNGTTDSGLN